MNGKAIAGDEDQNGLFATAAIDKKEGAIYIKVANVSDEPQQIMVELKGLKAANKTVKVVSLMSTNPIAENSIKEPEKIKPTESSVSLDGSVLNTDVPAKSFQVYIIK
jgi:alpha-L-arabinofuranosidase